MLWKPSSVLNPKFACFRDAFHSELRIQKDTRIYNSSVLLVRKSANEHAEKICGLANHHTRGRGVLTGVNSRSAMAGLPVWQAAKCFCRETS